jgi:hypothetical protein
MKNIVQATNILSNVSNFFTHEKVCQGTYMQGILACLKQELGEEFEQYKFILFETEHGAPEYLREYTFGTGREVVFYLGDEAATVPHELMQTSVYAVFKHYLPHTETGYRNLFSLPLGYLSSTPHYPVAPINERSTGLFFSGALHYTRLPLLQHFTAFKKLPFRLWNAFYHRFFKESVRYNYDTYFPNSIIRFNRQGFKSGFTPEVFGKMLYDCKIALCPTGVINRETYRHFEALRAGCVVLSEPLPNQYFYTGSPIITVPSWHSLDEVVHTLLANPTELARLQQAGLAWWRDVCSEAAVARYIAGQLRELATLTVRDA